MAYHHCPDHTLAAADNWELFKGALQQEKRSKDFLGKWHCDKESSPEKGV
jgi:hypothetical protein